VAQVLSLAQLVGQAGPPEQRYAPQEGLAPELPAAREVHVPGVLLHTSQPPPHALLQQ
jgi:hypothetical protein